MAARQGELFPEPIVAIHPGANRCEPRLWVRRLVIWEDPDKIVRDISLRRGLNIIWSPDPGANAATVGGGAGSGHGAGKTLFCRLLRYCLGEDTFANDDLRRGIAERLPNGLVGVEVMVDSNLWTSVRSIGNTRRQIVRRDTSLAELVSSKDPNTGTQPLLEALSALVAPVIGQLFVPSERSNADWFFAVAWLTRDQECRYDHILDWRHARADTRSPVLGASRDQMVSVTRSFLGVLEQEEVELKTEREQIAERKRSIDRDRTYYRRHIDQLRPELANAFGIQLDHLPGGQIELGTWRDKATEQFESEVKVPELSILKTEVAATRQTRDGVLSALDIADAQVLRLQGINSLHKEQLRVLNGERTNLLASEIKAKLGPVCPICNVPIDRALAEGCRLSHVVPDAETLAADRRTLADQTNEQHAIIASFDSDIAALKQDSARLRNQLSELDTKIREFEAEIESATQRSQRQWTSKHRGVEKVEELQRAYDALVRAERDEATLEGREESIKNRQAELRAAHKGVLQRFEELFDYVCRGVLGNDVRATVSLSGSGITADVEVGGMAMESLKAIAFDLAAMLMSVEGRTVMPAFLVHDSPREADLGVSIYHRWFRQIANFEKLALEPPFQYVITSTTEPPPELAREPFLIVRLDGGDPGGRLLRIGV